MNYLSQKTTKIYLKKENTFSFFDILQYQNTNLLQKGLFCQQPIIQTACFVRMDT